MYTSKIDLFRTRVTLLIVFVFGALASLVAADNADGLFEAYLNEISGLKSKNLAPDQYSVQAKELNIKWQKRFQEFVSQGEPSSEGWKQIASELMALNQALGREDEALKINEILLSSATTEANRLSLQMNKAEVLFGEYTQKPADSSLAKKTSEAFEELFMHIDAPYNLPAKLSSLLKYGLFAQKNNDYALAAKVYKKAGDLIDVSKSQTGTDAWASLSDDIQSSFSPEIFLDLEIRALVRNKDEAKAADRVKKLLALPEVKDRRSYFFERFATYKDPAHGAVYQKEISDWLDVEPKDSATASLSLALANSLYRDGDYSEAAKLYSGLLSEPIAQPRELELKAGAGGDASDILYNLAICLERLGDDRQAKELFRSFSKMFPNDSRNQFLSRRIQ